MVNALCAKVGHNVYRFHCFSTVDLAYRYPDEQAALNMFSKIFSTLGDENIV